MNIIDFLSDYFTVEDLKDFIDAKLGLSVSGRKDELIDRIIESERFHPKILHDWMLKEDLKDICDSMRIKVSGNKQVLWERILAETNYFDDKYSVLRPRKQIAERKTPIINEVDEILREGVIDPKHKPLLANLNRLEIFEYLSSSDFKNRLLELNLDILWNNCQHRVKRSYRSNLSYIEENIEALGIMLTIFSTTINKEDFLNIISEILIDFAGWETKKDFSKIKNNLLNLGYSDQELKELFNSLKKTKIQSLGYHRPRPIQKFSKRISIGILFVWLAITIILWGVESFSPLGYQPFISLIKWVCTIAGPIGLFIFLIRRE